MRIEESLRRRIASRGCSDMPTTLAAGCTDSARAHAGGAPRQRGFDDCGVTHEDQLEGGIGGERAQRAGNALRRTAVATHHIDGDRRMRYERGAEAPQPELFFGLDFGRFFDDALAAIKTVRE